MILGVGNLTTADPLDPAVQVRNLLNQTLVLFLFLLRNLPCGFDGDGFMAVQTWWRGKVAEVKGAFRSVQTPSAPSAGDEEEEDAEEVISTFGGFLMKADDVRGRG